MLLRENLLHNFLSAVYVDTTFFILRTFPGLYLVLFCLDAKKTKKSQGKRDAAAALPCHASPSAAAHFLFFTLLRDGVSQIVHIITTVAYFVSSNPKLPY